MATFTYEPISLAGPVSRLLRLHRGIFDEIKCDLFEAWIGESSGGIPYSALSYTWGASTKDAAITVNERVMNVTTNLLAALQHLRFADEDRVLWVDAICIDQENNQERTHQVQHMSRIYQEAEKVLVWLGIGNEKSDTAMNAMNQMQQDIFHDKDGWRESAAGGNLRMGSTRTRQEMSYETALESTILEGLKEIFERPWFRRVWILQEVANARVVIIHCGTKSVSARVFTKFPAMMSFVPDAYCQAVLDIMPGPLREKSWWGQDRTLQTLLMKFALSEASDRRDTIYALIGISSDAGDSDILLPDYTKSLQDVVCDYAKFLSQEFSSTARCDSLFEYFEWDPREPFEIFISGRFREIFLNMACEYGNEAVVKSLRGTRAVANSKNGQSPLKTAASNGNNAIVELLLEDGAYADVEVALEFSLHEAVHCNNEGIVATVLDYRARVYRVYIGRITRRSIESALVVAAAQGYESIVKLLLRDLAKETHNLKNKFSKLQTLRELRRKR